MNAVFIILIVLIIIAAILLIGVVLLQNSKGNGMASNFVAGNQTFGVRQTADILEKSTSAREIPELTSPTRSRTSPRATSLHSLRHLSSRTHLQLKAARPNNPSPVCL